MADRCYRVPDLDGADHGFDIEGIYSRHHPDLAGTEWSEHFNVLGVAPVGVLADYAASATGDGQGGTVYRAPQVVRFLRGVMADPDSLNRLDRLIVDRYRPVPLATLVDAMIGVGEDLLGRPTGAAST